MRATRLFVLGIGRSSTPLLSLSPPPPPPPPPQVHAWLLYDKLLNYCLPHWLRYFLYSAVWHVFPLWFGKIKGDQLVAQCSEPLVYWLQVGFQGRRGEELGQRQYLVLIGITDSFRFVK